jgi:hypothetical protein
MGNQESFESPNCFSLPFDCVGKTIHTSDQMEPVQLPNARDADKVAFVIRNVFTAEECDAIIKRTEEYGYEQATVNTGEVGRDVLATDYRKSLRCIMDDNNFADELFRRVQSCVPDTFNGKTVIGVNERLRILKYNKEDFFLPHMDGSFRRPGTSECSYLTIQLYLNEGAEGGATRFLASRSPSSPYVDVVPETGMVLIFQHDIIHEGAKVEEGIKYTMRSDIMYGDHGSHDVYA